MALIKTETFMLASPDPGIRIHLRNKRLAAGGGFSSKRIVLFVHGATFPSETGFDFEMPGGSWLDIAAPQCLETQFGGLLLGYRDHRRSRRPLRALPMVLEKHRMRLIGEVQRFLE